MHKRQDVQGLRAIAVLAVIAYHAGLPVPGGFTGVDVFFVISGFVICSALLREWSQNGAIDLPKFYFRRFKRLAPALALLTAFTMIAASFFMPPLKAYVEVAALTGIGALFFFANAVIASKTGDYFQPRAADNPLLHTWSLSVEEQFYIGFPTLLLLALHWQRRNGKRAVPIILAAIACVSVLVVVLHASAPTPLAEKALGFYSPLTRAWEFLLGALIPFIPQRKGAAFPAVVTSIGFALLGASFWLISAKTPFPGIATAMPVLGAGCLIWSGGGDSRNFPHSLLSIRPLVWIGDASYSLYLWHWPMIVFASIGFGATPLVTASAAALSFIPAALAYHYVETPIRRYEPRLLRRKIGILAPTSLPGLALCLALLLGNQHGYWSQPIQGFQNAAGPFHIGLSQGCGLGYVPRDGKDRTCNFGPDSSRPPIYLIGDSNADHLSEAAIASGEASGRPVTIFTKGGCGFIGKSVAGSSDVDIRECRSFVDGSMSFLDKAQHGSVIIGISDAGWAPDVAIGNDRRSETKDPVKKSAILEQDLISKVQRLQKAGHDVTLLLPIPKFLNLDHTSLFDYAQCSTIAVWLKHCPSRLFLTRSYEEKLQKDARASLERAAKVTGARTLDMLNVYCREGRCTNITDDGVLLYRDTNHLSVAGDALAVPAFISWAEHYP